MELSIYICGCLFVIILLVIVVLIKKKSAPVRGDEPEGAGAGAGRHVRAVDPTATGGARRRRRMGATNTAQHHDPQDSEEEMVDSSGKKLGAKKLKKLQEKAEKKAQREADEEERKDNERRKALLEEQRKKDEDKLRLEEEQMAARRAEEREEQERRDQEEYLRLREAFSVDEEGVDTALTHGQEESLLQDFINYIKCMKVIMLEDLASHFKMKTQDVIDRIQTLLGDSHLTGVLDDRGKFIYITAVEYEAVARYIKQRGRMSINELAESSNHLINLNPENMEMHRRLIGDVS